jgi:heat shock protein HslJ
VAVTIDVLDGTSWTVVGGPELPAGATVTAGFADGAITGTGGCNRYQPTYASAGTALRLTSPVMSTLMACPPPLMTLEADVFARLARVDSFLVDDDTLTLFDDQHEVLLELRTQGADDLIGSWTVLSVHMPDRQAIVSVEGDLRLEVEEEVLHGNAGCNQFRGGWSTDGPTIRIGPLAATRKVCADSVMAEERAFLAALEHAAGYRLTGPRLDLLRPDRGIAVTLQRPDSG